MNVSELPTLLGLRRNFIFRLSCDHAMFARRFELNVTADERSWLGKCFESFRREVETYLGQIDSSEFHLKCRPSSLGAAMGRIPVHGSIRQVGGLTVLEGVIDGYTRWKSWVIMNSVATPLLAIPGAILVSGGPINGSMFFAFLPLLIGYLFISALFLFFLTSRETERLLTELEKDLKEWVR